MTGGLPGVPGGEAHGFCPGALPAARAGPALPAYDRTVHSPFFTVAVL